MEPEYQAKKFKYERDKYDLAAGFASDTHEHTALICSKVDVGAQIPTKQRECDQLKSTLARATIKA